MGKFTEWVNAISDALDHDIQRKVYIELMKAWGEGEKAITEETTIEEQFPKVADTVEKDMKKTIESCIDHMDLSFMVNS